jgi:hypothetical protein
MIIGTNQQIGLWRADARRQRIVAQVSNLLYRGFPTRLRYELSTPRVLRTACRLEVGDTAGWKPALRELDRTQCQLGCADRTT